MKSIPCLVLVAATFVPFTAAAQEAAAPKKFESSAGAKLLLGGSLSNKPSNTPPGYDGLGFVGSAGGFAYGFAGYYEGRFVQHLGLEADLGYDHTQIQRNVTYNVIYKTTEKFVTTSFRLTFLAKGIANAPFGRMWLGLGPEFVFPSEPSASLEETSGPPATLPKLSAVKKSSTNLVLAAGMVIHVGDKLEIPIDLRAGKNLSQDSSWQDRVTIQPSGDYSVVAQASWDFRLATGLGYRF
jgi:hypothetical protein